MTNRDQLPLRRACESFTIEWGGFNKPHVITVGYYHDGRVGEVFITGGKSGEQVEAIARDGAVLLSLALQYGASLKVMQHAITRNAQNEPQTIVGAVIDALVAMREKAKQ